MILSLEIDMILCVVGILKFFVISMASAYFLYFSIYSN